MREANLLEARLRAAAATIKAATEVIRAHSGACTPERAVIDHVDDTLGVVGPARLVDRHPVLRVVKGLAGVRVRRARSAEGQRRLAGVVPCILRQRNVGARIGDRDVAPAVHHGGRRSVHPLIGHRRQHSVRPARNQHQQHCHLAHEGEA